MQLHAERHRPGPRPFLQSPTVCSASGGLARPSAAGRSPDTREALPQGSPKCAARLPPGARHLDAGFLLFLSQGLWALRFTQASRAHRGHRGPIFT